MTTSNLSKCCGAGSEKSIGYTLEESPLAGTWDYLCSKCGRPCDVVALPPVASPTVFGDIQKFLSTCTEKEFDAWLLVSNSLGNRKL